MAVEMATPGCTNINGEVCKRHTVPKLRHTNMKNDQSGTERRSCIRHGISWTKKYYIEAFVSGTVQRTKRLANSMVQNWE